MAELLKKPENCNTTEVGVAWRGSGAHQTDSSYIKFGSTNCGVARKKVWMKIENFPSSGLQNKCLNSSCPFNTGVPDV